MALLGILTVCRHGSAFFMSASIKQTPAPGSGTWLAFLALAALLFSSGCARRDPTPGACNLPARTKEPVPRFAHTSGVYYRQRDKRWAAEPIGGSGKPLAAVGCTICCLSMALNQQGIDLKPAELNRELKKVNGFTSKGWLYWPAIAAITGGKVEAKILWHPTLSEIERALAAGDPVIVKVAPPPMIQHWVLLVGREGREFLMKDPLDHTQTVKPLSSLGSRILAARVVKRSGS